MSRRLLQIVVVLLSLLPLTFGTLGVLYGIGRFDPALNNANVDSQFRFLSAWYLGLAMLGWWIAAGIERHTAVFRIVCVAVFAGGLARLASIAQVGMPDTRFLVVLAAELLFPLLIVWQASIARAGGGSSA